MRCLHVGRRAGRLCGSSDSFTGAAQLSCALDEWHRWFDGFRGHYG
jgi:hypothetical protein